MVLSPFVSDIRWLMKFLKILGLILAVFVLLLVSLWWACSPHQPSDAELVRQFKMHRTDLDHLVEMMNEDWQMSRIAPDFTWRQDNLAWPRPESEWGITKDRWDDYRSMFRKVGAKGGTTRRQKSSDIIIDIWSWGDSACGDRCGISALRPASGRHAHTEEPCIENRDSGRGMHGQSTSYGYSYRKIEPDWFIYEESN
jgi:hypothetical protein